MKNGFALLMFLGFFVMVVILGIAISATPSALAHERVRNQMLAQGFYQAEIGLNEGLIRIKPLSYPEFRSRFGETFSFQVPPRMVLGEGFTCLVTIRLLGAGEVEIQSQARWREAPEMLPITRSVSARLRYGERHVPKDDGRGWTQGFWEFTSSGEDRP